MELTTSSHRETDDNYARVVVLLNARWRVAVCKDGLQWILQRRAKSGPGGWASIAFCQTSAALRRNITERIIDMAPEGENVLRGLPSHIEKTGPYRTSTAREQAISSVKVEDR